MNSKEIIPNERLRRARLLKGWSQAELAEQVGTSFEMVSRWERGVTVPGPHYRKRLCAVLGQTVEELGLMPNLKEPLIASPSPLEAIPSANQPLERDVSAPPTEQTAEHVPLQSQVTRILPLPPYSLEPTNTARPIPTALSEPTPLLIPDNRAGLSRIREASQQQKITLSTAGLLIGLVILLVGGALLGSVVLLIKGALLESTILLVGGALLGSTILLSRLRTTTTIVSPIRGGTWRYGLQGDVPSLIPNGTAYSNAAAMDQALYLPLFYGDAQGVIHAGAATEVPTIENGGVNADATTWTFHLRPHLFWSDGQPYDARDVDFTWRLWANPSFGAASIVGLDLISSTEVSEDHLSITFHLKQPFAPFLANLWVDGLFAPLPAHHFSLMAPEQILKSSDNLNPKVTSGPFIISESLPGDHYILVRNPKYYLASDGLPYLDKVVFDVIDVVTSSDLVLKELQAGSIDSTGLLMDAQNVEVMQGLKDYTLIYPPTQNSFEALYFNFHNTVLTSHPEVRQAMAMAVDQQTVITEALKGLGTPLCTNHPSAYHPGFDPNAPCPLFDLKAANKLLDDHGWVRGPDGVRARDGQRLEFQYSTALTTKSFRLDIQKIIQRDFGQIGIKLDIQNYPSTTFFSSFLNEGQTSPPPGAVAGRYDIAEWAAWLYYDPDDSSMFACNQFPSVANNFTGLNISFYCNPDLDKLFAQEQATADAGVRQQIFIQIHQLYLTQFPFIVLCGLTGFALAHKRTHNYLPGPYTDTYNIAEWWCDNGKC